MILAKNENLFHEQKKLFTLCLILLPPSFHFHSEDDDEIEEGGRYAINKHIPENVSRLLLSPPYTHSFFY